MIPVLQESVKSSLPGKERSKIRLGAHTAAEVRAAPGTSPMPECNKNCTS